MIVVIDSPQAMRLDDPWNFSSFALVLTGCSEPPAWLHTIQGDALEATGDMEVWIAVSLIRRLRGVPDSAEWRGGFDMMLRGARSHGWVRETPLAIKAHVRCG